LNLEEEKEEKKVAKRKPKVAISAKKAFAAKYANLDTEYDRKKAMEIRQKILETTKKGPNYVPRHS
jgi:hypothetical protein